MQRSTTFFTNNSTNNSRPAYQIDVRIEELIKNGQHDAAKNLFIEEVTRYMSRFPQKYISITSYGTDFHFSKKSDIFDNHGKRIDKVTFNYTAVNGVLTINGLEASGPKYHDIKLNYDQFRVANSPRNIQIGPIYLADMTAIEKAYDSLNKMLFDINDAQGIKQLRYAMEKEVNTVEMLKEIMEFARQNDFDAVDELTSREEHGISAAFTGIKKTYMENNTWNRDTLLRLLVKHAPYSRQMLAIRECQALNVNIQETLDEAAKLVEVIDQAKKLGVEIQYTHAKSILNLSNEQKMFLVQGIVNNQDSSNDDFINRAVAVLGVPNEKVAAKIIDVFSKKTQTALLNTMFNDDAIKNKKHELRAFLTGEKFSTFKNREETQAELELLNDMVKASKATYGKAKL